MSDRERASRRPIHPIGVVAQRTGLSAELVRAWERRHGVVEPSRDEAGRRLYSDADVERLRLLARATSGGRSIGQLSDLSPEELAELVRTDDDALWDAARPEPAPVSAEPVVADALERARALDAQGLEEVLRRSAVVLGAWRFLEEVVAPLFRRVGDAWHAGELSIAAEHMSTAVARTVLGDLRGALPPPPNAPLLVVATPAGELHEIGALLGAGAAALEGWRVVYLGPDVPAVEVAAAAVLKRARAVALSAVYGDDEARLSKELATVRRRVPAGVSVLVGGSGVARLPSTPKGVTVLEGLEELRAFLRGR